MALISVFSISTLFQHGVFIGSIYSPRWGTFYVEKGRDTGGVTHSVIYHEKDITLPHGEPTCIEMKHGHKPINHAHNTLNASYSGFKEPMKDYFEEPKETKQRLRSASHP